MSDMSEFSTVVDKRTVNAPLPGGVWMDHHLS
jgi:hypothetical protein